MISNPFWVPSYHNKTAFRNCQQLIALKFNFLPDLGGRRANLVSRGGAVASNRFLRCSHRRILHCAGDEDVAKRRRRIAMTTTTSCKISKRGGGGWMAAAAGRWRLGGGWAARFRREEGRRRRGGGGWVAAAAGNGLGGWEAEKWNG
ncbi:hypothetical protein Drorol1_Dr00020271 [Drosera rotundifolia]